MPRKTTGPVQYVVGLGHIAQAAVLPAFAHARNSRLVAVVSGDRTKRRAIAKQYGLEHAYPYEAFEECLQHVDAVYIALPNSQHSDYTVRAARAGVHVLCEKPMAVTVEECQRVSKYFNSSFSMTVRRGDIRTRRECGGGTLYDIGVYCINAARYLFRAEPLVAMGVSVNGGGAVKVQSASVD